MSNVNQPENTLIVDPYNLPGDGGSEVLGGYVVQGLIFLDVGVKGPHWTPVDVHVDFTPDGSIRETTLRMRGVPSLVSDRDLLTVIEIAREALPS